MSARIGTGVIIDWLPLGAGGWLVPRCGRGYEAIVARRDRRPPQQLFHSALEVWRDGRRYAIEMAPVWSVDVADRGVAQQGPVGDHRLGRFRLFRYEVRCWADGVIPDLAHAVGGPVLLSDDDAVVDDVLVGVSRVPALTWGRDELGLGEMWNSNSIVAWLLTRAGIDAAKISPPDHGRAPGWLAGVELARRQAPIRAVLVG